MNLIKYFFIGIFVSVVLWSCKSQIITENPPVVIKKKCSVLFVGNSYTYYNDGIDFHIQKMLNADATLDTITYIFEKIAVGSYTLEAHYGDLLTLNKIRSQKWTNIVLQEQSTRPINNPDLFLDYASKLDLEIKKVGAELVLFMTWAQKDQPGEINGLAASYISVGSQLKAKVVPVGKVWEYFQNSNSQIDLYISDNKHPTLAGTYATACVFYYSLFSKNPVNNTYIPDGISLENVKAIRKMVYDYMKAN